MNDNNDNTQPRLIVRMLGNRQYALMYNGRELDRLSYEEAFPIIAGKADRVELLARYGVQYEQG